jgi:UDP-glucose 4-epimerase
MTIVWVIGGSGLLGTALRWAAGGKEVKFFIPSECFNWGNQAILQTQIASAVQEFTACVDDGCCRWEIYWAAGIGTMGSSRCEMATETMAISSLLTHLRAWTIPTQAKGGISFASSAGAIYAGSIDAVIDENSEVAPTTPYAHEKLLQEEMVRSFSRDKRGIAALIARITTLYGVSQSNKKKQGLLTHLARRILANKPVEIYVPLDTMRDYISAEDAAQTIVSSLRYLINFSGVATKIIASGEPTSIARALSIYKHLNRRPPRVVTSANRLGVLYLRRMRFRSLVITESLKRSNTTLAVGIARILAAERAAMSNSSAFSKGR